MTCGHTSAHGQMKNNIHYSIEARRDLDDIWDYIVAELGNPSAAERLVNSILDAVDKLADFADMGSPLSAVAEDDSDYRYLVTGNYLTFYRVSGCDVYVDRILYGRRDYLRILFGDTSRDKTTQ